MTPWLDPLDNPPEWRDNGAIVELRRADGSTVTATILAFDAAHGCDEDEIQLWTARVPGEPDAKITQFSVWRLT